MGDCGCGQEFDLMLLIATRAQMGTYDPMRPGEPETRCPRDGGCLCTAESFHTLQVEALF